MKIFVKQSFIIPRIAQPPIVCIQNTLMDVPSDLAKPFLADGRAVKPSEAPATPTHVEREKAVIG